MILVDLVPGFSTTRIVENRAAQEALTRCRAIFPPEQEEELVREFFAARGKGYFVEVGANHPTDGSQTWHLEQAGWTGVLVEPQPDLAAFLATSRKAKVFAVACSSPDNAGSRCRCMSRARSRRSIRNCRSTGVRPETAIVVPTRTLDSILEEAEAPMPIDLLSIDVEGHETRCAARLRFRALAAAADPGRGPRQQSRQASLSATRRLSPDPPHRPQRLVRAADAAPPLDWQGRWEILRKYYLALPFRMLREFKRRMRDRIRLGSGG